MKQPQKCAALAALLFSLLAVWLCVPAAASGGGLTLETDASSVQRGQTLTVSVGVSDNPGIAYARFDVSYDPTVLTLTDVRSTGLLTGMFTTSRTLDTEPFVVTFASASDMTASGTAALLTFAVQDNAPVGETSVGVRCTDANNENLQKVSLASSSLSFRIACAEHTGGKATCTERAVCTVCGESYGELGSHRYGSWTKEISATCTEPGVHGYYCCSVCGRYFNSSKKEIFSLVIEPLGHKFGKYTSDGTADCTHDGTETGTCSRCGVTDTRTKANSALGHDFSGTYLAEQGGHFRLCSRCGERSELSAHKADKNGVCTVCGYVVSTPVGHTHTLTLVPEVPATCTRVGTRAYYRCTGCGQAFADAAGTTAVSSGALAIPALGHDYSGAYLAESAGHYRLCSHCGERSATAAHSAGQDGICSVCGYVVFHPVGHTHTLTFVPEVPATCTREGTSAYYRCTECGLTFADAAGTTAGAVETIPALGHAFTSVYIAEAAGHYRLCSRCGAASEMLPHTVTDGVCTVCGYKAAHEHAYTDRWSANRFAHWLECEGCGERIVVTAHTPGPAATATEPQTCVVCGYLIAPATGEAEVPESVDRTEAILWAAVLVIGFVALTECAAFAVALTRRK